jgi:hypothetical protein
MKNDRIKVWRTSHVGKAYMWSQRSFLLWQLTVQRCFVLVYPVRCALFVGKEEGSWFAWWIGAMEGIPERHPVLRYRKQERHREKKVWIR